MLSMLLLAALAAPAHLPPAAPLAPATEGVAWSEKGYTRSLRAAEKEGKLVFLAFVPTTSNYSQQVLAETFPDPRVAAELADLVCLQFTDLEDPRTSMVVEKYNVETYPTFVIALADGSIEDRIEGYIPPEPMIEQMQRIKAADGTVSWHRAQLTESEEGDELSHMYSLAQMLEAVRADEEAEQTYDAIREADPTGHTTAGARLALADVWDRVRETAGEDKATWNLAPVHAFLDQVPSQPAAFQGWTDVGNFHAGRDDGLADAADAFMRAWEHASDGARRAWARDVANFLVNAGGEELAARHQGFALELAKSAVSEAQRLRDEHVAETGSTESDDGGDYDAWVASHLSVLVQCQQTFGHTEDAMASLRRCTELDPENPEYAERLEHLVAQG